MDKYRFNMEDWRRKGFEGEGFQLFWEKKNWTKIVQGALFVEV